MAKRKKPALSDGFDTRRLDAIGAWKCKAHRENLEITWAEPSELAGLGLPFQLMILVKPGGTTFDPDDQIFALWDLFRKRKKVFAGQIKALVSDYDGSVECVMLVLSRSVQGVHEMSVRLAFDQNEGHNYLSYYEPGDGAFGPLVS